MTQTFIYFPAHRQDSRYSLKELQKVKALPPWKGIYSPNPPASLPLHKVHLLPFIHFLFCPAPKVKMFGSYRRLEQNMVKINTLTYRHGYNLRFCSLYMWECLLSVRCTKPQLFAVLKQSFKMNPFIDRPAASSRSLIFMLPCCFMRSEGLLFHIPFYTLVIAH